MPLRQRAYGRAEPLDVQSRCPDHERLIPVVWQLEVVVEEPLLNWKQRDLARQGPTLDVDLRRPQLVPAFTARQIFGQRSDRPVTEKLVDAKVHTNALAEPAQELDANNAVAAQLEKVVVDANLAVAVIQQVRPDIPNHALQISSGCDIALGRCQLRLR